MRIVFIGPPGAGKGTQSVRLAEELGLTHLSTGEVLREAQRLGTQLGSQADAYLQEGQLVPDQVVIQLVGERLANADGQQGYLFDGFPRTLPQAEALDEMLAERGLSLDVAVEFVIPEEELLRRLRLRKRGDDQEQTVRQRLRVYAAQTAPLVDYYHRQGTLRKVDAVGDPHEVAQRVWQAVHPAPAEPRGAGASGNDQEHDPA
ncbi:MAG: adenylate kinase [Planctomycetales bacterium]|nr:adenylate kinase [Planctomycetales bacterium]